MTRRRAWAAACTTLVACSTLAPVDPPDTCVVDTDCEVAGQVCGDGVCYEAGLPPREVIGLDVLDALGLGSRIEIHGTDTEVVRINRTPIRYSVSLDDRESAPGLRDELRISLTETHVDGVGDTKTSLLPGAIRLSQASRLGREDIESTDRRFDVLDAMGVPLPEPAEVVLRWSRYDTKDVGADKPLLVLITPDDGFDPIDPLLAVRRGLIYRQLVRPQLEGAGVHAFKLRSHRDCHRKIHGAVFLTDSSKPSFVTDVEFQHAPRDPADGPICEAEPETGTRAICSPQTIATLDGLPECITVNDCPAPYGCHATGDEDGSKRCGCASDSECPLGDVCELESKRCALDLRDLVATKSNVATSETSNEYDAWIYTYCEDDIERDRELDFIVTATPQGPDTQGLPPLPPLTFRTAIDFPGGTQLMEPATANRICLPAWAPPQPLDVQLSSEPQTLYTDASDRDWVCCSSSCLDTVVAPGGPLPKAPKTCPLIGATVTAFTIFTPDPTAWTEANCMALEVTNPAVPPGSQRLSYDEFTNCGQGDKTCQISLSRGEGSLEYEIRIESPVGSLIRSTILPPQLVDAETTRVDPQQLAYRVLLRGQVVLPPPPDPPVEGAAVVCDPATADCRASAEIMAERLRMPDEDPSEAIGPFFYTTQTIPGSDGDFVLPVNPGMYLVTALPQIGALGGPAPIMVVDLRLDSRLVDAARPVPVATLNDPIVLEAGTLVTVELDRFGRNSAAIPLDLAGWKPIAGFPALDLNASETCYGPPDRGCQIRRLRPGKSGLSPTQEQYVKYLTRAPAK